MAAKVMLLALLLMSLTLPGRAEDSEGSKTCIPIIQISSTKILNNRAIRFEMSPGPDYVNRLPYACPGLNRNKAIMYATSLSVLCDLDMITVLDTAGGGYMRGATCGLGKFVPVEEGEEGLRDFY